MKLSIRSSVSVVIAVAIVLISCSARAGYNVSVNTVSDFPSAYHRLAILPAIGPDGFDVLWLEKSVFAQLAQRQVVAIPADVVRQAIFDLGLEEITPETIAKLGEKLGADAFILSVVGSVNTKVTGAVSTGGSGATGTSAGGFWSSFATGFGATIPTERNTGSVQISIVTTQGRVLMKGQGFGESDLRSLKGVVGTIYDQIFNRAFSAQFLRDRKAVQSTAAPK